MFRLQSQGSVKRQIETLIHYAEGLRYRQRCLRRNRQRKSFSPLHQLGGRNHLIDQADAQRLLGWDDLAGQEQLERGQKMWNEAGEDAEKYEEANRKIAEAESKLESAGSKA